MKNVLKKAVVLLTLGSHSFAVLPMEVYDDLHAVYFVVPIALATSVSVVFACLGVRTHRHNDLEASDIVLGLSEEHRQILRQVRITPEEAEDLIWEVRQDQDAQEAVRLRRVERENAQLGRTVLSCQSAKTNKRKI